jgi:hypothetical protein
MHKIADFGLLRVFRCSIVGRCAGIPLVSTHDNHDDFVRIITQSLELIRQIDARRFRRVLDQTKWLVDMALHSGYSGQYHHRLKATLIDYEHISSENDLWNAGYFAGLIVHEATHGVLCDRGIVTTKNNRVQIERICRAEQNRFLLELNHVESNLGTDLQRKFDPEDWTPAWNSTNVRKAISLIRRVRKRSRANKTLDTKTGPGESQAPGGAIGCKQSRQSKR